LVELTNITKKYGQNIAVKDVSFKVDKGGIVGLLGRNGAGKTTTMNIITGYISATSGAVTINGYDTVKNPREAKKSIGYLPEHPPLYNDLTVEEYLAFACRLKDVKPTQIKKETDRVLESAHVADVRKRLIGNLSKGYRQRVGLAQALCGSPELVILDEPTAGLDPKQIVEIRSTIRELGQNHTVILSSHILSEVADICQKVIIINRGEVIRQDSLGNLTHQAGGTQRVMVRLSGDEAQARQILKLPGVSAELIGQNEADTVDFMLEGSGDLRAAIYDAVKASSARLLLMRPVLPTLEDIFITLTSSEGGEA
jgi:ABC-2 type transport system ATP-binding protein